jgi:hypothetical protein
MKNQNIDQMLQESVDKFEKRLSVHCTLLHCTLQKITLFSNQVFWQRGRLKAMIRRQLRLKSIKIEVVYTSNECNRKTVENNESGEKTTT